MSKKYISWNVNGLRACLDKGFMDFFDKVDADAVCLQEIKLSEGQLAWDKPGYHAYWNYAKKKGYSGTAIFSKEEPLSVSYDMGIEEHDNEGRIIALEYADYYLVTVYTPNSQRGLERLDYRMKWEDDFRVYLNKLRENKPVIVCGDMNVAHKEIDLKNPKSNRKNAGFTDEESHKEVARLFNTELPQDMDTRDKNKALDDIVMRIVKNSLEVRLKTVDDLNEAQQLMQQQNAVKTLHISMN